MPDKEKLDLGLCPRCGAQRACYILASHGSVPHYYCPSATCGFEADPDDWNAAHAEAQFAKRLEAEERTKRAEAALREAVQVHIEFAAQMLTEQQTTLQALAENSALIDQLKAALAGEDGTKWTGARTCSP